MKIQSILSLTLFVLSTYGFGQQTYIQSGQLFDAASGKMLKNKTLVVEGKKLSIYVMDGSSPMDQQIS